MISEDLFKRLLEAFPENAEKIEEYVRLGKQEELRELLLKISGMHPSVSADAFRKPIEDFKKGFFNEVNIAVGRMRKERLLVKEAVGI